MITTDIEVLRDAVYELEHNRINGILYVNIKDNRYEYSIYKDGKFHFVASVSYRDWRGILSMLKTSLMMMDA
jgi:hypothetical protein